VYALGERKTRLFRQALQKGIDPAGDTEALQDGHGSKNIRAILHAAGLEHHFDVCVDGLRPRRSSYRESRIRH
jgi:beta-phosphoglucomutase-like phosphatase (HAD superfamily)